MVDGFTVQMSRPLPRGGREITRAHLLEAGPCLKGLGETETVSVKADLEDEQDRRALVIVAQRRRQLADCSCGRYRQRLDLLTRQMRLDRLLHAAAETIGG